IRHADHGIIVGRRGARFEGLEDSLAGIARTSAHAGLGIDANQLDAGGNTERSGRLVGERDFHEIARDRRSQMPASRGAPEIARLVVTYIDSDDEVRRKSDEPGVLLVVGGAGLARNWLAY